MQPSVITLLREFGLGACLALAVFALMFWLVKNVMKDHRDERKNYQAIISNHLSSNTKALNDLVDKTNDCGKLQQEANRYVREEHREILKALMKLNNG